MFLKQLVDNNESINNTVQSVMNHLQNTNSSVLTKGRQTWCPLTNQSLPSASAYNNMANFLKRNTGMTATVCLEWIKCFFICLGKSEITATISEEYSVKTFKVDPATRQKVPRVRTRKKIKTTKIVGNEECYSFMMDLARSFCSYIKHGERAKLNIRAIASANPILRMFLYAIEEFHLRLSKLMMGSTIGVGGEEKKKRISLSMQTAMVNHPDMTDRVQSTQDAQKWNECLSADLFCLLHETYSNATLREVMEMDPSTEVEKTFLNICRSGHFLLACKMITLGEGPICYNDKVFNRPSWTAGNLHRFNQKTQQWFQQCIPYMHKQTNYLQAYTITLRSSDDSMTFYLARESSLLDLCIEVERRALKLLGINLSLSKTLIFKQGYGEYTSWYQDGEFISQFGVETSTVRPQGKNPMDDFYSIAKGTSISQQRLEMNPFGAAAKLTIGIDNCRRLWRIKKDPNKRENISSKVLLLADGGDNSWTPMRCHLEETSLKEHWVTTDTEKSYLLKIRHPDNPFCSEPLEDVTFSVDLGRIITDTIEVPRTVFHYGRRTNRTKNPYAVSKADVEDANATALDILENADLSCRLKRPSTRQPSAENVCAYLRQLRSDSTLTEEQQREYETAMNLLRGLETTNDDFANQYDLWT